MHTTLKKASLAIVALLIGFGSFGLAQPAGADTTHGGWPVISAFNGNFIKVWVGEGGNRSISIVVHAQPDNTRMKCVSLVSYNAGTATSGQQVNNVPNNGQDFQINFLPIPSWQDGVLFFGDCVSWGSIHMYKVAAGSAPNGWLN